MLQLIVEFESPNCKLSNFVFQNLLFLSRILIKNLNFENRKSLSKRNTKRYRFNLFHIIIQIELNICFVY